MCATSLSCSVMRASFSRDSTRAGVEQAVGPHGEPVLDRGVVGIAEIAREEVALEADRAHAVEDVLEGRLAGERRAQAALDQAAALRERDLVLDREPLRRELRMRDDDLLDALLERRLDD